MSVTAEVLPIRLLPNRLKWAFLLLGAAAFVCAGIWIAPQNRFLGYSSIVFFGLCFLVGVLNLPPGSSYLLIEESGFTFASLFRKHSILWGQVERFIPVQMGIKQMVGWKYSPDHVKLQRLRSFNMTLLGAEAALPDTYGMSVTELIELLEGCRVQYGSV